jgi:hypothetical protein
MRIAALTVTPLRPNIAMAVGRTNWRSGQAGVRWKRDDSETTGMHLP